MPSVRPTGCASQLPGPGREVTDRTPSAPSALVGTTENCCAAALQRKARSRCRRAPGMRCCPFVHDSPHCTGTGIPTLPCPTGAPRITVHSRDPSRHPTPSMPPEHGSESSMFVHLATAAHSMRQRRSRDRLSIGVLRSFQGTGGGAGEEREGARPTPRRPRGPRGLRGRREGPSRAASPRRRRRARRQPRSS